ncbi:MAG: site-specific DNA-methyltransferase [Agitococcus sp.]|nr:site-specific DNA-methyltransferase [Agitococcus sp.]MDO9179295.1 site-specific DNA-methyltransferase [Agitococcus sp.]
MNQTTKIASPQLDLFSTVLHAYSAKTSGILDNRALYENVAVVQGMSDEELNGKVPIGAAGALHNPFSRKVRWHQQTLKASGILERIEGEQGVWGLTKRASKDLNQITGKVSVVGFSTELGIAILGCCETVFSSIDAPITLVITSPPYPLAVPRQYGNVTEKEWVDWICKTLEPVAKNLVPGGSICLNVSNDIFITKSPARSLYRERLVLALHDRLGLWKMDELIWENKSKPPGPIQYASIERTQLNVVYEPIYWFTNNPHLVKSDNRRVLQAHTERHLKLIQQGGEQREGSFSDGAYSVSHGSYSNPTAGKIPRNILSFGHRCPAQDAYKKAARAMGLPAHGAPMPMKLASFLIEFLSQPGDLVVDPFAGSFTTADAAERLGRRWLATECMVEYVMGASSRFASAEGFNNRLAA